MLRKTLLLAVVLAAAAIASSVALAGHAGSARAAASNLHVSAGKLVDNGQVVHLHGVDQEAASWCWNGAGIWAQSDASQTTLNNLLAYHVNLVRIQLNEDCWLGINGVPAATSGANYRTAIENWVNTLTSHGIYVIADLHFAAGGTTVASSLNPMADADHSPAFWTSAANAFKSNQMVIFDLFNEPHVTWSCWQKGGCATTGGKATGMQQLINAVRATGAKNVVDVACQVGGTRCTGESPPSGGQQGSWLQYKPSDPNHNMMADGHVYMQVASKVQHDAAWMNTQFLPLIQAGYPVAFGEFSWCGDHGLLCDSTFKFPSTAMNWQDQNGSGYAAFSWRNYPSNGAVWWALIADNTGTTLHPWGTFLFGQYQKRFSSPAHSEAQQSTCTPTGGKVVRSGDAFAGSGSDACSGKVRVVIRSWVRSVGHWVDQASASGPGNNTIVTASGFCKYSGKSSDSRAWQRWTSWSGGSGNYKTSSVNDTLLCVPLHS